MNLRIRVEIWSWINFTLNKRKIQNIIFKIKKKEKKLQWHFHVLNATLFFLLVLISFFWIKLFIVSSDWLRFFFRNIFITEKHIHEYLILFARTHTHTYVRARMYCNHSEFYHDLADLLGSYWYLFTCDIR